jgi:hypothetical protein
VSDRIIMSNAETNNQSRISPGGTTPPLPSDIIIEAEELERFVRVETLRHIEGAWRAHQRLMQACLHPDDIPAPHEEKHDAAKVDNAHSVERGSESDDVDDDDAGASTSLATPAPESSSDDDKR